MSRWTPKGKPKDGYYYDGNCPRCGDLKEGIANIAGKAVCPKCNSHEGVKITENDNKQNT